MNAGEALRELAELSASQWGMVTTAQAGSLGVTRLMLTRLTDAGHLERLAHGVYKDAGVPSDQWQEIRAAWLGTEPKLRAEERLRDLVGGVVVASSSAAMLHGVGDLWASRHEFVAAKRRQTQRTEIRYRQRQLDSRDVTLLEGLPVMTLERTLADLLDDIGDMSLVADALGAAMKQKPLDLDRLRELFAPLAERHGFAKGDGEAVLERLTEIAGADPDSVARRLAKDPVLGAKIVEQYFASSPKLIDVLELSGVTTQLEKALSHLPDDLVQKTLGTLDLQPLIDEHISSSLPRIDDAVGEGEE